MDACGCIGILIGAAGVVAVLGAIVSWILGPVDRAAKDCQLPTQFTIADFLCLFGLIHLPATLIYCLSGFGERIASREAMPFYVLSWLAVTAVWWVGVGTLSRAGVVKPWQRVVFLLVVFPILLIGVFAQMIVPMWLFATFHPAAIVSQVGLALLFVGLHHLVLKMLKSRKPLPRLVPSKTDDSQPPADLSEP